MKFLSWTLLEIESESKIGGQSRNKINFAGKMAVQLTGCIFGAGRQRTIPAAAVTTTRLDGLGRGRTQLAERPAKWTRGTGAR